MKGSLLGSDFGSVYAKYCYFSCGHGNGDSYRSYILVNPKPSGDMSRWFCEISRSLECPKYLTMQVTKVVLNPLFPTVVDFELVASSLTFV